MSWQSSIQAAVRLLQKEESRLERELSTIRQKIRDLGGVGKAAKGRGGRRRLSDAGRKAIARAAKRRWAAYRASLKKRG